MKKLLSKNIIASVTLLGVIALLLTSCGMGTKSLHGEKLLSLSDEQLFETVYFQNIDIVTSFPDEVFSLSQMSTERRTVYILSIYDMEIQNGGLCQFFVNFSRLLAQFLDECFETVGAEEHRKLLSDFVADNNIDLNNLESFETPEVEDYISQTQRYDFDSFDNTYSELAPLQDFIVNYIQTNVTEF